MYQKKMDKIDRCPMDTVFEIFGGKWNAAIYCLVAQQGSVRYTDFRNYFEEISNPVLSATLKHLMKHKIIARKVYDEIPMRVEYYLTEKGKTSLPIFKSFCRWSMRYHDDEKLRRLPKCKDCEMMQTAPEDLAQ